jgi:hypothetical protein
MSDFTTTRIDERVAKWRRKISMDRLHSRDDDKTGEVKASDDNDEEDDEEDDDKGDHNKDMISTTNDGKSKTAPITTSTSTAKQSPAALKTDSVSISTSFIQLSTSVRVLSS